MLREEYLESLEQLLYHVNVINMIDVTAMIEEVERHEATALLTVPVIDQHTWRKMAKLRDHKKLFKAVQGLQRTITEIRGPKKHDPT